jgi:hypothetical protein
MAVYKQPKSKYWWYKFTWNGEAIRESTKQTNKRVAEQMDSGAQNRPCKGRGRHTRQEASTHAKGLCGTRLPAVRAFDLCGEA